MIFRHFRQNRQPPRGHFWHPIQIASGWRFFTSFAIFAICMHFWTSNLNILPHIASPLAIFAKIANFAKIASLQGATFGIQFKSPEAGDFSPVSPLHAWNFAKIAIFAKIASLQGATFGIQFKSPAAGDFSPVSPFSPLHAFLDISERRGGGTGNLICPPFCLFPIKKWRLPDLCWALPEGQPNN